MEGEHHEIKYMTFKYMVNDFAEFFKINACINQPLKRMVIKMNSITA
jgi:hypothetical protein